MDAQELAGIELALEAGESFSNHMIHRTAVQHRIVVHRFERHMALRANEGNTRVISSNPFGANGEVAGAVGSELSSVRVGDGPLGS